MRVLTISHMFPQPSDPIAGIFVLEQAKALRKLGIKVLVTSPIPWAPRLLSFMPRVRKYLGIPARSDVEGFTVDYLPVLQLPRGWLFWLYGFFFYLACRKLLRKSLAENPIDLIHAHTIMPDGFAAVLLGREFNIPAICTIHGGDISDYPVRSRLTFWATKWALKRIDHLIAVSHELKQRVLAMVGRTAISVVHNGADSRQFRRLDRSQARTVLQLPLGKKIVLFVGYLVKEKGLESLLDAFSGLLSPDTLLYLVGDGYLREDLLSQADRLGVRDKCFFVGRRPHDEIPFWLSAADFLVLSSVSEGLPTILTEAMLSGLPIIATRVGGIPEIVRDGETGILVPSQDAPQLTLAMRRMLSDCSDAEAMARNAERSARQSLTWECNARRTVKIYEALAGTKAADSSSTLVREPV